MIDKLFSCTLRKPIRSFSTPSASKIWWSILLKDMLVRSKLNNKKITTSLPSSNKQLVPEQVRVSTFSLDTSSNSKYNVFCLSRRLSKKGLIRRSYLQMTNLQLPKRRCYNEMISWHYFFLLIDNFLFVVLNFFISIIFL